MRRAWFTQGMVETRSRRRKPKVSPAGKYVPEDDDGAELDGSMPPLMTQGSLPPMQTYPEAPGGSLPNMPLPKLPPPNTPDGTPQWRSEFLPPGGQEAQVTQATFSIATNGSGVATFVFRDLQQVGGHCQHFSRVEPPAVCLQLLCRRSSSSSSSSSASSLSSATKRL